MEDLIGQPGLPGPAGPQGMPVSLGSNHFLYDQEMSQ